MTHDLTWERLSVPASSQVDYLTPPSNMFRAAVPGGWLVYGASYGGVLTFVPDPTHKWKKVS